MRSVVILVVLLSACGPAVEVVPPPTTPATLPPKVPAAAPRARVTGCTAQPGTIYGQEAVVFRVEGEATPGAMVKTELRDEHDRIVSTGSVSLPGEVRPLDLPSGDFVLIVGTNRVSCAVTVNRELSRATQNGR